VLLAAAPAALPAVAQDDEQEPQTQPATQQTPKTVREMAEQMDTLEQEVDKLRDEISEIQKGRLAEIGKEMAKQSLIISRSRAALSGGSSGTKLTPAQQREYNRIRREYARKLANLKKDRDKKLKDYRDSHSSSEYRQYKKKVEKNYEEARKDARAQYQRDLRGVKEVDGPGEANPKARIKEAEEQLKTLRQERLELGKKIAELRKALPAKEAPLRKLREHVAAHPEEAWEAGLRPRFGSYYIDEQTRQLAVRGGTWGHPRDNDLWKRSNAMQAKALLALAGQLKQQGKLELARTCLQRIQDEFADLPEAAKARKLMEQPEGATDTDPQPAPEKTPSED
jgi:hypothetical protein